jgi:hypothetical protein
VLRVSDEDDYMVGCEDESCEGCWMNGDGATTVEDAAADWRAYVRDEKNKGGAA